MIPYRLLDFGGQRIEMHIAGIAIKPCAYNSHLCFIKIQFTQPDTIQHGLGTGERGVLYPADPVAQKHGAGVAEETSSAKEAYAGIEFPKVPYKQGWLAD